MKTRIQPEAVAGDAKLTGSIAPFGDKKAVAQLLGMSVRSVDNYIQAGLPVIKLSARRCRFDLAECRQWFIEQYRQQRRAA